MLRKTLFFFHIWYAKSPKPALTGSKLEVNESARICVQKGVAIHFSPCFISLITRIVSSKLVVLLFGVSIEWDESSRHKLSHRHAKLNVSEKRTRININRCQSTPVQLGKSIRHNLCKQLVSLWDIAFNTSRTYNSFHILCALYSKQVATSKPTSMRFHKFHSLSYNCYKLN